LRFHWSLAYGEADPIYNGDIGFHLFELPFLELLQNGMLAATLIASSVLMLAYSSAGLVRLAGGRAKAIRFQLSPTQEEIANSAFVGNRLTD
jgi:uncharacterized membrane protein (UPF0182 family)